MIHRTTALSQTAIAALVIGLSPHAHSQVRIAPDDPQIDYSEFVLANITPTQASFLRNTTAAGCCGAMAPGVRANFRTDATRIDIVVNYVANTNFPLFYGFGVEIDGVVQPGSIGQFIIGNTTLTMFSQPSPVLHDFSLIWPIGAEVNLVEIQLTGGSGLQRPSIRPRQRAVFFGDSITQGVLATDITESLPYLVGRLRDWSTVNMGYSGHTTVPTDGVAVASTNPGIAFLAIGTNDFGTGKPLPSFESDYDGWIASFRSADATTPIVCITPIFRVGVDTALEAYRDRIRTVLTNRRDPNVYLLEGWDMLSDAALLPDGLHPGDLGFAVYAQGVANMNLVRNAGFELLVPGFANGYVWDDLGGTSISSTVVNNGLMSMQIDPGGARSQTVFGLSAGDCYTLTAFARMAVGTESGSISVEYRDVNNIVLGASSTAVTGTQFQQYTVSGTAPANTTHCTIRLDNSNTNDGPMWVDDLTLPWNEPPTTFVYEGCNGTVPAGSLSVVSGTPTLGSTLVIALDDPNATMPNGAASFVFGSLFPSVGFPCGSTVPDLGMAGPNTPSELLIGNLLSGGIPGTIWNSGTPALVNVPIANDCAIVGAKLYWQGLLWNASSHAGLTGALETQIGS